MIKNKVKINSLIFVSESVFDISKILTYEIYYDYMTLKGSKKVNLLYMDTDSLIMLIKTFNIMILAMMLKNRLTH